MPRSGRLEPPAEGLFDDQADLFSCEKNPGHKDHHRSYEQGDMSWLSEKGSESEKRVKKREVCRE
jgi:hypothetical protein